MLGYGGNVLINKSDEIKKATISLFAKRGFDGTTIPFIAENASVGAGTIYRYFANKEELLNLVMQDEILKLEKVLRSGFPEESDTREQFGHLFHQLMNYSLENFDSIMLISSHCNSLHIDKKTEDDFNKLLYFISNVAERGRDTGNINKNLPNDMIVSIIFGSVVELAKNIKEVPNHSNDQMLVEIEKSLWRAISLS